MRSAGLILENLNKNVLLVIIITQSVCIGGQLVERENTFGLGLDLRFVNWDVFSRRFKLINRYKDFVLVEA